MVGDQGHTVPAVTPDADPTTQWETFIAEISGSLLDGCNQTGLSGWRPWAIVGDGTKPGSLVVAFTRPKRRIVGATEMPGKNGLILGGR